MAGLNDRPRLKKNGRWGPPPPICGYMIKIKAKK